MEIEKLIKERRSVSLFEERDVDIDELKKMIETAVWVPNHKNTQPWRFVIITGDTKERLAQLAGEFKSRGMAGDAKDRAYQAGYQMFAQVPVYVMVMMDENHVLKRRQEDYASTSLVIHNLSLIGWEKGLGMIWKTGPLTEEKAFRELIQIEKGEKFVGMIQIGYPKKVPKPLPRVDINKQITELT
ncbi:Nitroreductase [Pelagirhabdus alkalitolerans]|uniref:Putative NAD(P)H nitroreductase n=1 Tax=Pelagirhabdus alkalitolerans TaxID=1612202 RepID=A0A1G6GJJ5_9BACI|nr:nitroreductase [Pelagirhabdus alkalitolerans]SDB82114.1 Nitroreductase [Pelagirhabdus alkalitolerans]